MPPGAMPGSDRRRRLMPAIMTTPLITAISSKLIKPTAADTLS
jgi:hypothetical protein